jgi:2,4-dienoyl-CoA reductase-like NADH-dependent reductase (Old Yellow Enzyme family)
MFSPFHVKNLELRNRFVRSATYDGGADKSGHVTEKQITLFSDLAAGGVGLIITGITYVHASGQISSFQNSLASDDCIRGFRKLTDVVHNAGGKIAAQLFHAGREASRFLKLKNELAVAPSYVEQDQYFEGRYRAIKEDEIQSVVRAFGEAARRAREAEFDAIQLHAAHGYLFSQFLSPYTNSRKDMWGGSLVDRLRFHSEVCREVRQTVGEDYPILMKIGVKDGFPEGLSLAEGIQATSMLEKLGINVLEISQGLRGQGYENSEFRTRIDRISREAYFLDWCKAIRLQVDLPLILVGGLRSFKLIEKIVERNEADLIALSRPLIRKPSLINDWGNENRDRSTCVSCNKCFEALLRGKSLYCRQRNADQSQQLTTSAL